MFSHFKSKNDGWIWTPSSADIGMTILSTAPQQLVQVLPQVDLNLKIGLCQQMINFQRVGEVYLL